MTLGRPKGSKNRKPEVLDPQLAKLTAIVADTTQDAETRAAAAKALQDALTPTVIEPQAPPSWWDDPNPWSEDPAECARHEDLWRKDPRNPKNKPQTVAPPVAPPVENDLQAFERELDEIEKELGL